MSVPNVVTNSAAEGVEYGILIYDIAEKDSDLYSRVYTRISRRAIRLNMSVYLCIWGMRDQINMIIEEAQQETGKTADIFFAKFDNSEEKNIVAAAKRSLIRDVQQVKKRLLENVASAKEKAAKEGKEFKHIRVAYARKVEKKLAEAKGLAIMFGFSSDIDHELHAAAKLLSIELEKILEERRDRREVSLDAKQALDETEKSAEDVEPAPTENGEEEYEYEYVEVEVEVDEDEDEAQE
jgi:hypothetical protein